MGGFGVPGGTAVDAAQCWDDAFQETYYDSWRGPQLPDGGVLHVAPGLDCDAGAGWDCPRGDPSRCAF